MKRLLSIALLVLTVASLALAATAAAQTSSAAPRIQIIRPVQNGVVPLGTFPVQIQVENFAFDETHYWQVFIDGTPAGITETRTLSATVSIFRSGPHEIRAALSDGRRAELAAATVTVTAAPATPKGTWFNLAWSAPAFALMMVGIIALVLFSLRITRRTAG